MKAKKLRDFVETAVTDLKGQNIVIMDISKMSSIAERAKSKLERIWKGIGSALAGFLDGKGI